MSNILDIIAPGATLKDYPDRAEWLIDRTADKRKGYLGSTDVAAVLGWSNYAGPWDVWTARWGTLPMEGEPEKDRDPSGVLSRGLAMEPLLWAEYRERYNVTAIEVNTLRVLRGAIAVSPDALVADEELGWGVGEGKTVMLSQSHWVPREDAVIDGLDGLTSWPMPRAYLAQCLAQVVATGLPFCDLFVAVVIEVEDTRSAIATDEFPSAKPHAVVRFVRIRVIPTAEDLAVFKARLGAWVGAHLVGPDNPPPFDDSRPCYLHHLGECPELRKVKVEATEAQAETIGAILEASDAEKAAKKRKQTHRAELVSTMGKAKTVYVLNGAGKRITATVSTRGTLTVREPKL